MLPGSSESALEVGLGWTAICRPLGLALALGGPVGWPPRRPRGRRGTLEVDHRHHRELIERGEPVGGRDVIGDLPGAERPALGWAKLDQAWLRPSRRSDDDEPDTAATVTAIRIAPIAHPTSTAVAGRKRGPLWGVVASGRSYRRPRGRVHEIELRADEVDAVEQLSDLVTVQLLALDERVGDLSPGPPGCASISA